MEKLSRTHPEFDQQRLIDAARVDLAGDDQASVANHITDLRMYGRGLLNGFCAVFGYLVLKDGDGLLENPVGLGL